MVTNLKRTVEGGNGNISKENGNVSDEGSTISIEDTSCSDESFDDEEIIFNSNISVEDLDKRFLEKCQLYQMSLLTGEKYEDMEKVSKKKKKEVLQEKSNRFDTSLLNQQYNEKRLANIRNRSSDLLSDKSALDLFTSPSDKEILLASKKSNNNQFLSYLDKAQSYLEKMTIHSTTNELFNEESNRREASERKNDEIKSYYVFNEENTRKEKVEKRKKPRIMSYINKNHVYSTIRIRLNHLKESGKLSKEFSCPSFLTWYNGYKVHVNALVSYPKGEVQFSVRVYNTKMDKKLSWPFKQKFRIKLSSKMESKKHVQWYLPSLYDDWEKVINKPFKKVLYLTEYIGPFDIKEFIALDDIFLDVYLL